MTRAELVEALRATVGRDALFYAAMNLASDLRSKVRNQWPLAPQLGELVGILADAAEAGPFVRVKAAAGERS